MIVGMSMYRNKDSKRVRLAMTTTDGRFPTHDILKLIELSGGDPMLAHVQTDVRHKNGTRTRTFMAPFVSK